jgi:hypothetical protein
MCKRKSLMSYLLPKLVLKVKQQDLAVGFVMEGSLVFCKKDLEHSMSFHGDYIKRCLLMHGVSQILYLTKLISEIKYISDNGPFTTQECFGFCNFLSG